MKIGITFIFVLYFSTVIQAENNNKTKISVYYESLCSDSENFFYTQLMPTYDVLKDYMHVDLVPFGKAMFYKADDGKMRFSCQHGAEECVGNAVHACGLQQKLKEDNKLQFANCMMTVRDTKMCAGKTGMDYKELKKCFATYAGNLLAEYGKRTMREIGQVTYIPTIIFNDKYVPQYQKLAETNLFKVICKLQNYPTACLDTIKLHKNKKYKRLRAAEKMAHIEQ